MPSIFPFVEKEGKHFTPITERVDRIELVDGALTRVPLADVKSGVKGVYGRVRFVLLSPTERTELFSAQTEFFPSSN